MNGTLYSPSSTFLYSITPSGKFIPFEYIVASLLSAPKTSSNSFSFSSVILTSSSYLLALSIFSGFLYTTVSALKLKSVPYIS